MNMTLSALFNLGYIVVGLGTLAALIVILIKTW